MNYVKGNRSESIDCVEGSPAQKGQSHKSRRPANKSQDVKPVTVIVNVGKDNHDDQNRGSRITINPRHNHSNQESKSTKNHKVNKPDLRRLTSTSSESNTNTESCHVGSGQRRGKGDSTNPNITNRVTNSLSTVSVAQQDTSFKCGERLMVGDRPIETTIPLGQILTQDDSKHINKPINSGELQSHNSPEPITREFTDDVVYFHFKDADQDDIRFRVNNLGTYVMINGQSFSGELLSNDGRLIKFKYTNKSGNVWFWTIDQITRCCEGASPRLFKKVEMKSILLNDSILLIGKQRLMNSK